MIAYDFRIDPSSSSASLAGLRGEGGSVWERGSVWALTSASLAGLRGEGGFSLGGQTTL